MAYDVPGPRTAILWGLKVLGVFAVFTVIATAMFMGGFKNSGTPEESSLCEANLLAVFNAAKLYAVDNEGYLPAQGWDKAIANYLYDESVLSCPRQRRVEPKSSGYSMNQEAAGKKLADIEAKTILFFDSRHTEHGSIATLEDLCRPPRHRNGRANSVVYANGKTAAVALNQPL